MHWLITMSHPINNNAPTNNNNNNAASNNNAPTYDDINTSINGIVLLQPLLIIKILLIEIACSEWLE